MVKEVGDGGGPGVDGHMPEGLDDGVKRRADDDQVADHGERLGAEGLENDPIPVAERTDMLLAGRRVVLRAVRLAIDVHAAGTADPLPAVGLGGHGLAGLGHQLVVEPGDEFQEGHLGGRVSDRVGLEAAGSRTGLLPPHIQDQLHL